MLVLVDDRQRDVTVKLYDRMLGHRLRERVDVREAHRVRVDAATLDEAIFHPTIAQALCRSRYRGRARRPHSRRRLPPKPVQDLGLARFLLHWPAQA